MSQRTPPQATIEKICVFLNIFFYIYRVGLYRNVEIIFYEISDTVKNRDSGKKKNRADRNIAVVPSPDPVQTLDS